MMKDSAYSRPAKPLYKPVRRRPSAGAMPSVTSVAPIAVDRASECHVTPPEIAARMVDYLFPNVGDFQALEPSAGTGNIVEALFDAGHSHFELCCVERHEKLWRGLQSRFPGKINGFNECFLDYSARAAGKVEFAAIIMNPPFSKVKAHLNAALTLLGRNGHAEPGKLIALVPITYEHERATTLEELPRDSFSTAKVSTKIIEVLSN